jgi:hypothetical protein
MRANGIIGARRRGDQQTGITPEERALPPSLPA